MQRTDRRRLDLSPMPITAKIGPTAWWLVTALVAIAVFWAATSGTVYNATMPTWLSFAEVLRKICSVIAFALVGFFAARRFLVGGRGRGSGETGASRRSATVAVLQTGVALAAYSGAIEVVQKWRGATEGLESNAFDVLCGFVGGAIGALILSRLIGGARRPR